MATIAPVLQLNVTEQCLSVPRSMKMTCTVTHKDGQTLTHHHPHAKFKNKQQYINNTANYLTFKTLCSVLGKIAAVLTRNASGFNFFLT